jgi:hypothetical protein
VLKYVKSCTGETDVPGKFVFWDFRIMLTLQILFLNSSPSVGDG